MHAGCHGKGRRKTLIPNRYLRVFGAIDTREHVDRGAMGVKDSQTIPFFTHLLAKLGCRTKCHKIPSPVGTVGV